MEHRPNPENSVGPLVGTIIIVLILVLGGLYFWGERFSAQRELRRSQTPSSVESANNATEEGAGASSSTPEYR